ncbi:MAG TPA: ribonuclease HII [Stenomitos sp.]
MSPRAGANIGYNGVMWDIEERYWQAGERHLAGVDEVGRGPLAGPVVVACVVLPGPDHPEYAAIRARLKGLTDSKKLSEARREHFAEVVREVALAWSIIEGSVEAIDRLNILRATQTAMADAVRRVRRTVKPDRLLVDGHLKIPGLRGRQEALVKGDARSISIAAASVIAKVYRDALMVRMHAEYPLYGFDRHKGYPTEEHLAAIAAHGLCPHHRRSFGPCKP